MGKFLLTLTITTVSISLFLSMSDSFAQSPPSTGFALRPAIVEIVANRGTTTTHTVQIENTSDRAIPVQLETQTLIPIDTVIDQERRAEFDASSWIAVSDKDFIFEPGEVEEVSFDVTVPINANPGGHYAIVALKPLVIEGFTQTADGAIIIPEIGTSVFITVPGDINEQAELDTTNLSPGRITQNEETEFSFSVRNTGNVHILPSPRITITQDGEIVEIFALQPQLILPNTEKVYSVKWLADVDYGTYQVRAELVYGNESIPLASSNVDFQVWPNIYKIIGISALGFLLLLLIIFRKNIPRALAVLRGSATTLKGSFKRHHDKTDYEPGDFSVEEVAKEIESEPSILGLPDQLDPIDFLAEVEAQKQPQKPMNKRPASKVLSKTTVSQGHTTTHITQTSASTIVRDAHSEDAPEKPRGAKKITVAHHDDVKPAKATSQKKATSSKKPATKTTTKKSSSAKSKKTTARKRSKKVATPKKKASSTKASTTSKKKSTGTTRK